MIAKRTCHHQRSCAGRPLGPEIAALAGLPVELALGGHPLTLLDGCDLLCLSGGVPAQIEIVQEAIARDIPLSNDSLLTLQLAAARAWPDRRHYRQQRQDHDHDAGGRNVAARPACTPMSAATSAHRSSTD